jgi:ryanodine receptor 2
MDSNITKPSNYIPSPIDTSGIVVPESILELSEMLANNTHELWAKGRLEEGWRYGPERDDTSKQHPCLVPYSDLPESEKKYDRDISMETLKVIISLGYTIEKKN